MNLTIRQFRAFLAVADLRSFTAASKYLCITQGAVSGLINEMESQMEVSLFDRTSRVVKLSPDGEKFLPAAMRVVEEFQRAENYARDLKEIKKSLVRVVGAPLIACAFLPKIIHAFKRQHPHTHVQLIDKPMSQLQKSIMLGEADFGIGPSDRWNRKSINKRCSQRKSPCTAIRTIGCIKKRYAGKRFRVKS